MPSTSAPYGFRPVRYRDGKPYTGQCNTYWHDSGDGTALFVGDPVILAGSATAAGIPTVIRATAGSGAYVTGVVVGVEEVGLQVPLGYGAASAGYRVLVADDPDLLFEIQEDAVGGALAATNIGHNADFVAGSGSTVTRLSGFMLDSSTAATTNTLQCRIHGLAQDPAASAFGAYGEFLVSFNLHQSRNLTGV